MTHQPHSSPAVAVRGVRGLCSAVWPSCDKLLPYEGIASPAEITFYQKRVGSTLYAAVQTRPDAAFASSRLARFNQNPSPDHSEAADQVLSYLGETRGYALKLDGEDHLECASDASFADNSIDRTSSQAYVMRLFGGTIGWKASKQETVTTSTTEAELLALAQAAKEAIYTSRLLKELGVELEKSQITLQCDNKQTLRLITDPSHNLQTRLRHVDVHNHWLRQEQQEGRINAVYTPTGDMIADGLTKALTKAQHVLFMNQMGLVDITELIKERRERELCEEDLEARLVGGQEE